MQTILLVIQPHLIVFVVLLDVIFHTHFRPSPGGVIISNHELIRISIVVGGNTSKCSPQAILAHEGAGRYINTFWAPFQELSPLSQQEVYAL